jgi:hypothetical protein
MGIQRQLGILALLLAQVVLIMGCSPTDSAGEDAAVSPADAEIICEVYYRAAAGMPLEQAPELVFTGVNEEQTAPFEELLLTGRYSVDTGEGRAFSIAVSDPTTGDEIARILYQLSPDGLRNQFVGGHGFTGLVYAYDPLSEAEMQFYCTVR